ncbi:hypothetical protein [Streptomyces sp. NK08204]|uniref:hypothetical protein n=1 Tax=Streptomyces sp. NK08204 TaxID=2873260 RepID=UPI001CECFCB6|nr:hypothetical protein [Streptomyces sp. NK08204]
MQDDNTTERPRTNMVIVVIPVPPAEDEGQVSPGPRWVTRKRHNKKCRIPVKSIIYSVFSGIVAKFVAQYVDDGFLNKLLEMLHHFL